jgi:hypothetical protein
MCKPPSIPTFRIEYSAITYLSLLNALCKKIYRRVLSRQGVSCSVVLPTDTVNFALSFVTDRRDSYGGGGSCSTYGTKGRVNNMT